MDAKTEGKLIEQVENIEKNTDKLVKLLFGNGSVGLGTKVELNRTSIVRAWAWLTTLSVGIIGLAYFAIRKLMTG